MKKNYIIGSIAGITALVAVSQTVLSPQKVTPVQTPALRAVTISDFPTHPAQDAENFSEGWFAINNNNDVDWDNNPNTWQPKTDNNIPVAYISYARSGAGPVDDYLLSPKVSLQEGTDYCIVFKYKAYSSSEEENLAVYITTSEDPETIQQETPVFSDEGFTYETYKEQVVRFTPTADDEYRIIFYCYSENNKYGMYISEVKILDKIAPKPVTDLTVTPADDLSISCDLNWTLPTEDITGGELSGEMAIEKVLVYRDENETPIELPADATSYTDTEEKGLTGGKHTYSVTVVAGGNESEPTTVLSKRIGPVAPVELPAKLNFTSEADFEEWTTLQGANSTVTKGWFYNDVQALAQFEIPRYSTDDNWLITPSLKVTQAGYFKVNLNAAMYLGSKAKFTLALGSLPTIESMQNITEEFTLPNGYSYEENYTPTIFDIYLEPGVYYLGLHNKLGEDNNTWSPYSYYVKGINIEASQFIPGCVTDLTAKGADDNSNNIVVSWKNPEVDNAGQSMAGKDIVVKIYLNDDEEPAASITDGSETCTIPVEKTGIYQVKAIVESSDGTSASEEVSVKSGWIGSPEVAFPYSTKFDPNRDPAVDIWSSFIYDINGDGKMFEVIYDGYYESYSLKINTGYYDAELNDFVLSPYFNLEEGTYKVKLSMDCGWYGAPIVIGYCKGGTFNPASSLESISILGEETLNDSSDGYVRTYIFDIAEEGYYQIVIGEVTTGTKGSGLEIKEFSISKSLPYPANVTDLKIESNPENDEEAIISWVNPTTVYGTETLLTEIEEIVIERDGEVIGKVSEGLVPGENASFIDKTLPEGGKYTYTVYATLEGSGHGDEYTSVKSAWIGGGITAPLNLAADDERWTIKDTHEDYDFYDENYSYNCWHINRYGDELWYLHNSTTNPADDYLIAPPVKVKENEVYKVTFTAKPHGYASQINYSASIKMGKGSDHTTLPEVAKLEIPKNADKYAAKEYSFYVAVGQTSPQAAPAKPALKAESTSEDDAAELYKNAVKLEAGSHTIALHANTDNGGLQLTGMKYEKVADLDITVGIGTLTADGVTINGNTVTFPGVADVKVFDISGVCVASEDRAVDSFIIPALTPGYYIIKVGEKTFKVIL